jgi:hypothetical protein
VVQTCPEWHPDGQSVVFARAPVDAAGNDSPPVALTRLNREGFAAVLPEVIPQKGIHPESIHIDGSVIAGAGE